MNHYTVSAWVKPSSLPGNVGIAGTEFNGFPYQIAGLYADASAKLFLIRQKNLWVSSGSGSLPSE